MPGFDAAGLSEASMAGTISLRRTDALPNLQASGAELAAQGVTHINNADCSRTCYHPPPGRQ